MRVRATGNRVVVLPDEPETAEVMGHRFAIDTKSGLILGGDTTRTTGVVLDVGPLVDDPALVELRERLGAVRQVGGRVETVRVLWIRDKSLRTTIAGRDFAFLAVPTQAELAECRACRASKYRNREEVLAILDGRVTLEVVGDDALEAA